MIKQIQNLNFNVETKGTGESIIFIHGLGGSLNIWNSQVNATSRFFQTTAYDLRGAGRTELSVPEYSIEVFVEDLKNLMNSEGIKEAHLVSHSMGTLIAQHFAVDYPDRVKSLTLVGGLLEIPEAGKKGLYDRSNLVRENGMDTVADAVIEGGTSSYSKHANAATIGLVRDLLQRNNPEGYAAACRALANGRAINHGQVQVPVLLIVGDEDRVTPLPMAKKLLQGFPNARLEVIENCGHWTTVEAPDAVNRALLSFLYSL
ncbi:alpha/beta fold hydrolase [Ammoniphilus sp. YIM 78166]|uniref:alpha/beta fold hydrolase n=1 Tax=Ammoniphilus sp. YIM 78166 TaxID=1644106 RepID=UPI00142F90DB|nr:alpha/beta hydrolase [Ammoniphilus sp. YIM 78166]